MTLINVQDSIATQPPSTTDPVPLAFEQLITDLYNLGQFLNSATRFVDEGKNSFVSSMIQGTCPGCPSLDSLLNDINNDLTQLPPSYSTYYNLISSLTTNLKSLNGVAPNQYAASQFAALDGSAQGLWSFCRAVANPSLYGTPPTLSQATTLLDGYQLEYITGEAQYAISNGNTPNLVEEQWYLSIANENLQKDCQGINPPFTPKQQGAYETLQTALTSYLNNPSPSTQDLNNLNMDCQIFVSYLQDNQ